MVIIGFMMNLLPSIFVLGLAALASVLLARNRKINTSDHRGITKASLALAVATLAQTTHFSEEAFSGFHEKFPALFGLPAMSFSGFMVFLPFTFVSNAGRVGVATFPMPVIVFPFT